MIEEPKNVNEMSIRQINKYFRDNDQSHLYPIFDRFNVTERAIRMSRRLRRQGLEVNQGLEYYLHIEALIINIVNNIK